MAYRYDTGANTLGLGLDGAIRDGGRVFSRWFWP
jgi:hypothetical protein